MTNSVKTFIIVAICTVGILLLFITQQVVTDMHWKTSGDILRERIERECENSYGSDGRAAVDRCRTEMMIRALATDERTRADETWDRIK